MPISNRFSTFLAPLVVCMAIAGCATQPQVDRGPVYDPNEADNRQMHAFNRQIDKALLRPVSRGYVSVVPDEVEDVIGNFADNMGLPNVVLNKVLQGDLKGASMNTVRFIVNSTLGLGGMFDALGEFGVEKDETDFGETLHVWGADEGAYVELPLFGPSTERDAAGLIVDFAIDPIGQILPSNKTRWGTGAKIVKKVGDRGRYAETVDSVLYDSADSYAQARLIYLQNRRFELGQEAADAEIDPFALNTEGF